MQVISLDGASMNVKPFSYCLWKELRTISANKESKLDKWRAKYGTITIGCSGLVTTYSNWGSNWFWTILGVIVGLTCVTMGVFDLKKHTTKYKKAQP